VEERRLPSMVNSLSGIELLLLNTIRETYGSVHYGIVGATEQAVHIYVANLAGKGMDTRILHWTTELVVGVIVVGPLLVHELFMNCQSISLLTVLAQAVWPAPTFFLFSAAGGCRAREWSDQ
jgi:hypothetical protein